MDICRSEQKDKSKPPHSEGMGMKSSGNDEDREEKSTPWSISTDQVASPHSEGMGMKSSGNDEDRDMELCWYAPFVDEILDEILVLVIHDDIVEPLFDELLFHGNRSPPLSDDDHYETIVDFFIPKARPFTPDSDSSEEGHTPDPEETQPKTGLPHPIQDTRPPGSFQNK